jgi:hypothetical protein
LLPLVEVRCRLKDALTRLQLVTRVIDEIGDVVSFPAGVGMVLAVSMHAGMLGGRHRRRTV